MLPARLFLFECGAKKCPNGHRMFRNVMQSNFSLTKFEEGSRSKRYSYVAQVSDVATLKTKILTELLSLILIFLMNISGFET